ncbi:MAG TPA: WYL domain-containing protein [Candidatus Limnocylindrales bacterium]|nr:WYL domain-containing protein [Candidatus Limnocylindrales bacterium]
MDAAPPSRVMRLEMLKALLADRDVATAADLAAELGVSVRTVHRDLSTLRQMGIPVEGERGSGGGLRLEHGWSLGRVHLNEQEAISLLLGLTIAEKVGSPLLLTHLRSVTRKVNAAFAPAQVRRIRGLRGRILVGAAASSAVLSGYCTPGPAVTAPILEAFSYQRMARIWYADLKGATTRRDIEAQYLYFNVPVWYALAWDHLRSAVRFFRLDRITTVALLPQQFRLRPAAVYAGVGEPEARTL